MAIYKFLFLLFLQAETLAVQIHKLLRAGDAYNAELVMVGYGDPKTVANNYLEVSNYLYWTASDLPSFITLSQQGLGVVLGNASQVQSTNRPVAEALQQSAAKLAFNLASFTWPGWNEPTVVISPADLAKGYAAAEQAVQLTTALKELQGMSEANWALGAHELARSRYPAAITAFEKSHQIASEAGLSGNALLARGYVGLVKVAGKSDVAEGERELKEAKDALMAPGIQNGQALVAQLDGAYRVFVKP